MNKFIFSKLFYWVGIILTLWIAIVERIVATYGHIVDANDPVVLIHIGCTIIYMVYVLEHIKHVMPIYCARLQILPVIYLASYWLYLWGWDMADFIKHPNMPYLIYTWGPPLVAAYLFFWAINLWSYGYEKISAYV
jgi:hypothetical protein